MDRSYIDESLSVCCIESVARLLFHARNHHGVLRRTIREAIRADIALLRQWRRKLERGG